MCDKCHEHISLQGNAPCGRSWTAIASPYWPEFAEAWVAACARLFLDTLAYVISPLHFAGFAAMPEDRPVDAMLSEMDFIPPRGKDNFGTGLKVSAGLQPAGRALPQLLPDGLGPVDHLTVAKHTPHPITRPPTIPAWCRDAYTFQRLSLIHISEPTRPY